MNIMQGDEYDVYLTLTDADGETITTKAAATITPGTSNIEIAAGTYLTGKQTIAGDAQLIGANIVSGHSIFGVSGTATLPTISQDSTTKVLSIS